MDDGPSPGRMASLSRAVRATSRRFARETHAGPIVEFAIIVPVLLILLLGVIDFARAFFTQNSLVAAVREGARYAAVQESPCVAATQTAIRNRVAAFAPTMGGAAVTNNAAMIPITIALKAGSTCGANPGDVTLITVEIVNYPYVYLTPVFRLLKKTGTINLSAKAVYRWERAPEF